MTLARLKLKTHGKRNAPGLFTDQRGATMVMGVFIAVLLVGMIYYVWGIGDAIMHRQRMQDASDTAAFSAAVIHARGMNMLALINMVMSALAMVAATMATIASMVNWAAIFSSAACAACPKCVTTCYHAARHGIESVRVNRTSNQVDRTVDGIMRGLHGYAVGIRYGVPIAAQAKVVAYGVDVYDPVTDAGVMAPPLRLQLPAQDDETNWPCDEKVLPTVRWAAPLLVLPFSHSSVYLLGGIAAGEARAKSITRAWCEDGYFQRIPDDAQEMGNDEYQVQAYMLGSPDLEWTQEGVGVAAWGQGEGAGATYTQLAQMGRVSFAQAEFFYDDAENDWHEWLWHMNWRARLRRFRVSASGAGGALEACGGGPGCAALGELGSGIDSVVVH